MSARKNLCINPDVYGAKWGKVVDGETILKENV